jgi:hypothetical protein
VPFTYSMAIGVRKSDAPLRVELEHALERECSAVASLLTEYGVPLVGKEQRQCQGSR